MMTLEDIAKFKKDCRVLKSTDKRPIKLIGGRVFSAKELRNGLKK